MSVNPTPTPVFQCPACNCGFDSPVNERTITLILSNVLWAVFFGISEYLGSNKNLKSKSLIEFLKTHLLHRDEAEEEEVELPPLRRTKRSRNLPRLESELARPADPTTVTAADRAWQTFKDWRDLRDYNTYLREKDEIRNDNRHGSSSNKPTSSLMEFSSGPQVLLEVPEKQGRKRTPSTEWDDRG